MISKKQSAAKDRGQENTFTKNRALVKRKIPNQWDPMPNYGCPIGSTTTPAAGGLDLTAKGAKKQGGEMTRSLKTMIFILNGSAIEYAKADG